jgi:hypothetical protein
MVRHIIGLLQQQLGVIPFLLGGDFNTDKSGFDYKLLTGGDLHTFKMGGDARHDLIDVFEVLRGSARALCHKEPLITNGRVPNTRLQYQIVSTAGQGDIEDT